MKSTLLPRLLTVSISALAVCTLVQARALAEAGLLGTAQVLLQEARDSDIERRATAKQKELDRLTEDGKAMKVEIFESEQSGQKVDNAVAETTKQIDQLNAEKKRLTDELELVTLRIDAEKLKAEGLKQLAIAHSKTRDALNRQSVELEVRAALAAAEKAQLEKPAEPASTEASAKPVRTPKPAPSAASELRKQLEKAEQASSTASIAAREAMDSATAKLKVAEVAAAKYEKRRAEIGLERNPTLPGGNDPLKKEQ